MGSQPWVPVGEINEKLIGFVSSVVYKLFPTYHVVQDYLIFYFIYLFIYFDGRFFFIYLYFKFI